MIRGGSGGNQVGYSVWQNILHCGLHLYSQTFVELKEPLDKMLTSAKGATWKRIRNTLSPTFSAHKMKLMVPLMNEACDVLLKKITEVADTGKSFDIVR